MAVIANMKISQYTLITSILIGLLFTSCKKTIDIPDELGDVPNQGSARIDDETHALPQLDLFLEFVDSAGNGEAWTMWWYSEGVEIHYDEGSSYPDSISGKGSVIWVYFIMNSTNQFIPTGNYDGMPEVEGFRFEVNRDYDNNATSPYYSSNVMTFNFEKSNDKELTFTFNGNSEWPVEKFISGDFNGTYRFFNVSN